MTLWELPVDRPRRGGGSGLLESRTELLDSRSAAQWCSLAERLGVTPSRLTGAALLMLLQRYNSQEGAAHSFAEMVAGLTEENPLSGPVTFTYGAPAVTGPETELSLTVTAEDGTFRLTAGYDPALFDAATVDRMLGHYTSLLTAAAAAPDLPVGRLPLLTAEEWTELEAWAGTAPDYPREAAIGRLFEEQVRRAPDRVAVTFGQESLTYAELNRRANRLAHALRTMGVGPDVLVGICAERSLELIVGLLAILKAGGAYVPLDPTYPAERLAFMLADTAAPVLLVQSHLREKLPAGGARVLCLDTDWAAIEAAGSDANPESGVEATHLAYVSYTSGSTGRPKGVLVPHRAVVRLVCNNHFADLGPEQVFLQLAPVPFDASTLEIWGALLNGARLVVMPPQTPTLEELARTLVEQGITILWLTAGLFHLMVEQHLDALVQVRQVLAGGDVLSVPHVTRMLAALKPGHTLINGYGPTENTTFT
ncbi:MAG TPA: AMP-binding protein, partial [Symbiobacteriaceae bacterium]|nr:AMP-binding protein [Symbiobacteriaceae bacterium]